MAVTVNYDFSVDPHWNKIPPAQTMIDWRALGTQTGGLPSVNAVGGDNIVHDNTQQFLYYGSLPQRVPGPHPDFKARMSFVDFVGNMNEYSGMHVGLIGQINYPGFSYIAFSIAYAAGSYWLTNTSRNHDGTYWETYIDISSYVSSGQPLNIEMVLTPNSVMTTHVYNTTWNTILDTAILDISNQTGTLYSRIGMFTPRINWLPGSAQIYCTGITAVYPSTGSSFYGW